MTLFSSGPRRAAGLGLSAVIGAGALFVGVAPASAVPVDTFTVFGTADVDVDGSSTFTDDLSIDLIRATDDVVVASTDASIYDGYYSFSDVEPGLYYAAYEVDSEWLAAESEESDDFTVLDEDVELPDVTLTALPDLSGGTITVTGSAVVGETLTATVDGVTDANGDPVDGVEYDLNWGYGRGYSGDEIEGATGLTVVVPEEAVGGTIGYGGYARADGFRPTLLQSNGLLVSAPIKAAGPAPVADSSELAAFLEANYVEVQPADFAGLPGKVEQGASHVADIEWWSGDSYVDVYAYSAPVFVGTFPVVDGRVQLTLTPELLAQLGEGSHTLVYTGQSSGGIQAVGFEVGPAVAKLAETGANPALPFGIGGVLLLLGAGLVVARRRSALASR